MARTVRAVAAVTPVRSSARDNGRMTGGFSFRLTPRWQSESPHTQNARIVGARTQRERCFIYVEEQRLWWSYKLNFYQYGKLVVW